MAKVEFSGIDQLELSFAEVAKLPDEVVDAMLNARADVVVEAQRQAAKRMLKGPYDTGETARSIKKGKPKLRDGQRVLYVTRQSKGRAQRRDRIYQRIWHAEDPRAQFHPNRERIVRGRRDGGGV